MEYSYLPLMIRERITTYKERIALRYKDKTTGTWHSITWNEMGKQIDRVSKALISGGIVETGMVGIFSRNMPEWTISDFGIMSIRAVPVPIYATDSAGQASYIIAETKMKLIFVGEQEQYDTILEVISKTGIQIKIVAFDENVDLKGYEHGDHFQRFCDLGKDFSNDVELRERLSHIVGDDIATILYTSGTTGEPKGVVLTYTGFINIIKSHDIYLNNISDKDISMAFLPLSHIFERAWTFLALHRGIQNNYLLNPREVVEAMQVVKPTIMCTVPRFFEKTYNVVQQKLETYSPLKKKIFHWAIAVGRKNMEYRHHDMKAPLMDRIKYKIADTLVLKKGRQAFGGHIRLMPCAGAMLPDHINMFFHSVGVHIIYAYGLTESLATVTAFPHKKFTFGTVGKPLPGVEVKIGENNEILIKCGGMFRGYYNKPDETRAAFTEDGWFKSGDAGEIDAEGNLIMRERIKDLIKTSVGKYVAPQQVESCLSSDPFIEQVMVIGDDRPFLVALVVPAFALLEENAAQQNLGKLSREELINHPKIHALMKERINSAQENLASHQQVKKFALLPEEFTIQKGEFTSTLKIKRKFIAQKYGAIVDQLYGRND